MKVDDAPVPKGVDAPEPNGEAPVEPALALEPKGVADEPPVVGAGVNLKGLAGASDVGGTENLKRFAGASDVGAVPKLGVVVAPEDAPNVMPPVPNAGFAVKEKAAVAGAVESCLAFLAPSFASPSSSLSAFGAKPSSSAITAGGPAFTKLLEKDVAGAGAARGGAASAAFVVKVNGDCDDVERGAVVVGEGEPLPKAGAAPLALKLKASGFGGSALADSLLWLSLSSSLSAPGAKPSSSGITAVGPGFTKLFTFGAALVAGVALGTAVVVEVVPDVFSVGFGLKEKGLAGGTAAAAAVAFVVKPEKAGLTEEALEKMPVFAGAVAALVFSLLSSSSPALGAKPSSSAITAGGPCLTKLPKDGADVAGFVAVVAEVLVVVAAVVVAGLTPNMKGELPGAAVLAPNSGAVAAVPAVIAGSSAAFALLKSGAPPLPAREMGTVSEFSAEPRGMADGALLSDTSEASRAGAAFFAAGASAGLPDVRERSLFTGGRMVEGTVRRLTRG